MSKESTVLEDDVPPTDYTEQDIETAQKDY